MKDSLKIIDEEVKSCTKCELHENRTNGVPGEGNEKAVVMFIGEGPGAEEDKQGRPFVGRSGKLYMPLYHPAVALYSPSQKEVLTKDMKKLPKLIKQIR